MLDAQIEVLHCDAVKAGHAEYVSGKNGESKWQWKKIVPDSGK